MGHHILIPELAYSSTSIALGQGSIEAFKLAMHARYKARVRSAYLIIPAQNRMTVGIHKSFGMDCETT
ncbi:hypothetical protein NMG60_11037148 [Bertholletia excelsa]